MRNLPADPEIIDTMADRFAAIFADTTSQALIRNLDAEIGVMECKNWRFPFTLASSGHSKNCYFCSATTTYIDYALDEARSLRGARTASSMAIRACAPLVRATGLDCQVQINNWLLSTNPMPRLSASTACALRDQVLERFGNRAIVIRSLNEINDAETIRGLSQAGFKMLAARRIYIANPTGDKPRRDAKRDATLLRETTLQRVSGDEFGPADFARCEDLYSQLYLEKYTRLNPQYTAHFLRDLHQKRVVTLSGLRGANGDLQAFTGVFENHGVLVQPFVGYDLQRPQSDGLYRMLMAIGREQAYARGLILNMSAGAAAFKRNRGARPAIEYNAVYVGHLPRRNRVATTILQAALNRIGIPLIKRYEL